ncbi:FAD-dependent oxidoreductase [Chloroflexota bacterium]
MLRRKKFNKLLAPFHIQQVELKNRMVCCGHARYFATEDGYVTDVMIASYEALAAGGVGLIIIGQTAIDYPMGYPLRSNAIADDKFIPGLSKLTKAIHKYSCPTFVQLNHIGPSQHFPTGSSFQPVSSSTLGENERPESYYDLARELTTAEIGDIVVKFALGAERALKAGFDGVEVHGAHSYLIGSFLSRVWNKRQDAYGCQDLENRARFAVEVIQAIKERVGSGFPVGIRLNGEEWGHDKGITPEESKAFAELLQKAGADYISVSGYGYGRCKLALYPEQVKYPEPSREMAALVSGIKKPGLLVPAAAAIKKGVSIPVVAIGRLGPELGEWILQKNKADLIGMVRRLIADPELPRKVASGRLGDIAPCTACIECASKSSMNEPIRCRINAAMGRELEYVFTPAKKKKRIIVVGGGPAGTEAARVASLRGHEVTLYEKEHKLGGLLPLAAFLKGLEIEDLIAQVRYFKTQLKKLGVRVIFGKDVTLALVEQVKPDAVIIAAGGVPTVSDITGIDSPNVFSSSDLHRRAKVFLRFFGPRILRWLTKFWLPFGKRVIIMGGSIHGCEIAEFMIKRGRGVTIVETTEELGVGIPGRNRPRLLDWLKEKGAIMLTGVKYERITDAGLTIITNDGSRQTIETDTILGAIPPRPNNELLTSLEGRVPEIYLIGDCAEPRKIIDAIDDGRRIGLSI